MKSAITYFQASLKNFTIFPSTMFKDQVLMLVWISSLLVNNWYMKRDEYPTSILEATWTVASRLRALNLQCAIACNRQKTNVPLVHLQLSSKKESRERMRERRAVDLHKRRKMRYVQKEDYDKTKDPLM